MSVPGNYLDKAVPGTACSCCLHRMYEDTLTPVDSELKSKERNTDPCVANLKIKEGRNKEGKKEREDVLIFSSLWKRRKRKENKEREEKKKKASKKENIKARKFVYPFDDMCVLLLINHLQTEAHSDVQKC